jgi:lysophospholipase L1-like esterase
MSTRPLLHARMNWRALGLVILATGAMVALVGWLMKPQAIDDHRRARQLVLHFTLSRIEDPVIIVGDSIVEASTLPRSICGHAIVNAGLSGASTASDLGTWLSQALDGKRAALIVVSLGTNDALVSAASSKQHFGSRYGALLSQLAKLAPQLAMLEIPPVETQGRMTAEMQQQVMSTISDYNSALPDLAAQNGATFVALPAMEKPSTIDGVHLNSGGYQAWEKAALRAAATACR